MCTLFANKLYSTNTYFYSPVWIMIVYNNFDAQNLLFICLQISPQIFAILQNFPINNLRDQQFCTLLCELEWPVVVLFTGIALEVEVPPGMVCAVYLLYFVLSPYKMVHTASKWSHGRTQTTPPDTIINGVFVLSASYPQLCDVCEYFWAGCERKTWKL